MRYESLADVPEKDVEGSLLFIEAAARLGMSRTATRIARYIANECLLRGTCSVSHAEFQRRTGVGRRGVDRAFKALLAARLVERVSRDDSGKYTYIALFERGSEYRAWGRQFDKRWQQARKAMSLRMFEAPAYPIAGADNAEA